MKRRILLLGIFILVADPGYGRTGSLKNVTFDETYDLFYQEIFHYLMPRVKVEVVRAHDRLLRRWGMENYGGLRHPLTVQVKDVPSKTLRRWEVAYVESRGHGENLTQKLVVSIGAYREDPDQDLSQTVTHEMAHVLLNDITSGPRTALIPPWFSEGLAQSVTQEGHDRVKEDIRALAWSERTLRFCGLDAPLDEFAHGPYNGNCYPEFYLALRRLEQLGGPETVTKIIRGLQQGIALPDLIRSLTGMTWPAFENDVARYAQRIFDGKKPIP